MNKKKRFSSWIKSQARCSSAGGNNKYLLMRPYDIQTFFFHYKLQADILFWPISVHITSVGQKQPPEVFCKKGVLKNFAKFTGKSTCARVSFLIKLTYRPAILLKKKHWHRCFPVNFVKVLRSSFLNNTPPGDCF